VDRRWRFRCGQSAIFRRAYRVRPRSRIPRWSIRAAAVRQSCRWPPWPSPALWMPRGSEFAAASKSRRSSQQSLQMFRRSQAGQMIEALGERGRRGKQRFQALLAAHDRLQRHGGPRVAALPAAQVKQGVRHAVEITEVAALALEMVAADLD